MTRVRALGREIAIEAAEFSRGALRGMAVVVILLLSPWCAGMTAPAGLERQPECFTAGISQETHPGRVRVLLSLDRRHP